MKYFFIYIVLIFSFYTINSGQDLASIYNLIEEKIEADKEYLNVYKIFIAPKGDERKQLANIPKFSIQNNTVNLTYADGYEHYVIFLGETVETDSIIILGLIEEIDPAVNAGNDLFGLTNSNTEKKINSILTFKDLNELYFNNKTFYDALYGIVRKAIEIEKTIPESLVSNEISEGDLNKSKGITGKNNQDYLNYIWVNSNHYFPEPKVKKRKASGREKKVSESKYYLDATFSSVTFHHIDYFAIDANKKNIFSLELNSDSELLNLLPWQSLSMSMGLRSFLTISDKFQNVYDDFLIEAKILGRFRLNTSGFYKAPFIFSEKPKLNVSSGLIFDLNTSRFYGLPFMKLHFAGGAIDDNNPYVTLGQGDSTWAYFNTSDWYYAMSFFWNTNSDRVIRFGMDIGFGAFDVSKVVYYKGAKLNYGTRYSINPYINFHFTFVPNRTELFNINLRFFDSVLKGSAWLKLFELDEIHTFRFKVDFVSSPLFRNLYQWENQGGTSIQINYRLGFKEKKLF